MSLRASRETKQNVAGTVQERFKRISLPTRGFGTAIQALSLYVSAGITACGWGTSRLLEYDARPYLLLWFAGSVLVYNVDKLQPDPADPVNTPMRQAAVARYRQLSRIVILVAILVLISIPLFTKNWGLLAMTIAAAFVCICYSFRFLGIRLKDVPLLKSFFAPSIAVAAFLFPPFWHGLFETCLRYAMGTAFWLWLFLCFNMILCDMRDIEGDRREHTFSLPVLLGAPNTRIVLRLLVATTFAAGLYIVTIAPEKLQYPWVTLTLVAAVYQFQLLRAPDAMRNEAFYEWRVEGMLFIPALAVLLYRV